MERRHREAIRVNFMSLVAQTDLDLMVGALYEKRVFSDAMIEDYRDTNKSIVQRKRQLYLDLPRRGPTAFQHLLDALSENGYWDLVRSLDPDSALHTATTRALPTQPGDGESSYLSLSAQRHRYGTNDTDMNKNRSSPTPASASSHPHNETNGNASDAEADPSARRRRVREPGAAGAGAGAAGAAGAAQRVVSPKPHFNVIKSTEFFEDGDKPEMKLYRARGRRRGVLVLFSYVTFNGLDDARDGGLKDHDNLKYLFTELGFSVISYIDLSYKETLGALRTLSQPPQLLSERPECVFVVFASHGYQVGAGSSDAELRCNDGQLLSLRHIVEYFSNARLPRLIGIPKVFIFQNCRGDMDKGSASRNHAPALLSPARGRGRGRDGRTGGGGAAPAATARSGRAGARGVSVDGHAFRDDDDEAAAAVSADDNHDRDYSDILIAHSTVPGYVSNRDSKKGSWYIQSLCRVFAERAHDCHVVRLFSLVDDHMSKEYRTQTSVTENWGFNRLLYLHPGLHEEA